MKKIPTIFERDWSGDKSRVVDVPNPKAQWVFDREGSPTRKLDGTSCMIKDGELFKRRELRKGETAPANFILADRDEETGKTVGWVPVTNGAEDVWHRTAFTFMFLKDRQDGTYELVGPKVQGNPEKYEKHELINHQSRTLALDPVPVTFDGLKAWLAAHDVEGIVWHNPDGRMAKIKARDFGIKRAKSNV